jgi:hypothetical protein
MHSAKARTSPYILAQRAAHNRQKTITPPDSIATSIPTTQLVLFNTRQRPALVKSLVTRGRVVRRFYGFSQPGDPIRAIASSTSLPLPGSMELTL